jgi:Family of unknown function (DUF5754)
MMEKSSIIHVVLKKSSRKDKKFMVTFDDGKTLHFGASGYSDFTRHKDTARRDRYDLRHSKRECWTRECYQTAGFWSKYLLWNKKTIKESIKDIRLRFRIKIIQL